MSRSWLRRDTNSPVEREALALYAERAKLSALKQERWCCKYALLHLRKQEATIKYLCRIDIGSQSCSGCICRPDKSMVVKPITFANAREEKLNQLDAPPARSSSGWKPPPAMGRTCITSWSSAPLHCTWSQGSAPTAISPKSLLSDCDPLHYRGLSLSRTRVNTTSINYTSSNL